MAKFEPHYTFCTQCKKSYKMTRAWQQFCTNRCRVAAHGEQAVARYARMELQRDQYETENDELKKRNRLLQDEIDTLRKG